MHSQPDASDWKSLRKKLHSKSDEPVLSPLKVKFRDEEG